MPTLDRAGLKLSYDDAGAGLPPMVFVHGWTCDRSFFGPQVDHFKDTHRVVGVDLRGHGESDVPDGDYSISTLADDVAWLCRSLDIEGAVVVGHSMGAIVGTELTARNPELVSALVLVDAGPIAPPPEVVASMSQLVELLAGPEAAGMRRTLVEQMLFLPTDDPALKPRVLDVMLSVPDRVAFECFRAMTAWPAEEALESVKVPALAIHADQPINDPERLATLFPGLTNAHTPGVGHFNQLLAGVEVNRLIEEFIQVLGGVSVQP